MKILTDRTFLILFIVGCTIRFSLSFIPGQVFDIDYWIQWSQKIAEVGPANFYGSSARTDYMPGYLYILWLLGFIKNLFSLDQQFFLILLKMPGILAELFLSVIIYILFKPFSPKLRNLAAGAILLNPALIFNSAVWGQIDSLLTLFMLLTVVFLYQQKLVFSSIFFSLSFLIKPQTLSLIFLPLVILCKKFSFLNFIKLIFPAFITIYLISLPFFPNQTFLNLFNLFSSTANQYSYNSLSAFNFWGIFGFWKEDNQIFLNFSIKNWGILMYLVYSLIILYYYYKKRFSLFTVASLATLGFYFLPTRVHERYLYPAIIFLIISSTQAKSSKLFLLTAFLSIIHFLNLLYVYTMYNNNFFALIYHFLEKNTTLISIVSCGLFIIISSLLIKNGEPKATPHS